MFVSACGQYPQKNTNYQINPEFDIYVQKFEQYMNVNVNLDIDFNKQENPVVGKCTTYTTGYKNVEIDPDFWAESSEAKREELFFHELGHCVLNRKHNETMLDQNNVYIPKSIMYPYVFSAAYLDHTNYYLDELKNPETKLTDYL